MSSKPLRCRLGFHSYVQRRPDDERSHGPDHTICRLCGRHGGVPYGNVPSAGMGGPGGIG